MAMMARTTQLARNISKQRKSLHYRWLLLSGPCSISLKSGAAGTVFVLF